MKERSDFAHWSFKHGYLSVIIAALAVLGYRFGIMNYQIALIILVGGAAMGLMAVLSSIVSILGIITSTDTKVSGTLLALVGMILGLAVVAPIYFTVQAGFKVPQIHDITTDLQDPPTFKAIRSLRTTAHNSLERKTPANLAELQQAGYPDLEPLRIDKEPSQVFKEAVELAKARDWEVINASAKDGVIEAIATTTIMGFKDDVVIRVTNKNNHTIVDMRSVSRIGISDMGTNAARIKSFLNDLKPQELN